MNSKSNFAVKPFKVKSNAAGQLLKIHHTVTDADGTIKRIPFCAMCFSDSNDRIVAADSRGNIFVFDLSSTVFWLVPLVAEHVSVMRIVPGQKTDVIIGTGAGELLALNTATGDITNKSQLFATKLKNISFPESTTDVFVAATRTEAIIVDRNNFQSKQKLSFDDSGDVGVEERRRRQQAEQQQPGNAAPSAHAIKQMAFMPASDQLYGCFTNDSIHIWANCSFQLLRYIHPIKARNRYLIKPASKPIQLDLVSLHHHAKTTIASSKDEQNAVTITDNSLKVLLKSITKDYSGGVISAICFSANGKSMCIGTIDDSIMLFSTDTWCIEVLLETPRVSIIMCAFVAPSKVLSSGNASQCETLAMKTSLGDTVVIDVDRPAKTVLVERGHSNALYVSKNGKMLAIVRRSGEILVHSLDVVRDKMDQIRLTAPAATYGGHTEQFRWVSDEITKTIPNERLRAVLNEYHEYPTKHRQLIWQSLLKLPNNIKQFAELLKRGSHPCTAEFDEKYPLQDVTASQNLKRIVSALAHWSPVIARCDYIANFVFPFLKVFENNVLMCFETVVTVLLNHGQLWFEFTPLEPINYLGMLENILAHFEPALMQFYETNRVTATVYGWSLVHSAFTEVLDDQQWLQLWDNIITQPSEYLLFCAVAYNVLAKSHIMRLGSVVEVENFFEEPTTIDVVRLIKKADELYRVCPTRMHPRNFMIALRPLSTDQYQKIANFPKVLVQKSATGTDSMRDELRLLNRKMYELEKMELALVEKSENESKREEHARRLAEVERTYEKAISREADRVAYQKKHLLLYQKQLREREQRLHAAGRANQHERNVQRKESELDTLLHEFQRDRQRDENELMFAEEKLKTREAAIQMEKLGLMTTSSSSSSSSLHANDGVPMNARYSAAITQLVREKAKLHAELEKIKNHNSPKSSSTKIIPNSKAIKGMLEQIQIEFARITECSGSSNNFGGANNDIQFKNNKIHRNYK